MSLIDRLTKLQINTQKFENIDREEYKTKWKYDLDELNQVIAHKWLKEYENRGLLKTTFLFVIKLDYFIGEYVSTVLDIELPNKYFVALEPVASISENHDGHIMLYLRGDRSKKVDIYRILKSKKNKSDDLDYVRWETKGINKIDTKVVEFNKKELENIIESWLQF